MPTIPYVEQDCTFTHEGRSFTTGGAVVTPDRAIGYLVLGHGEVETTMQTWHGERMGKAWIVASWSTPHSFVSSRMYQVEAMIDGVRYTGRTAGDGMIWRGRRKAD